jgi:predicted nucleic acid-binding Zn ribbon protein
MLESIMPEVAYKCDRCGELFKSPEDAQDHNQKAHAESAAKIESGSSIMGTGTPSEDREIERTMSDRAM